MSRSIFDAVLNDAPPRPAYTKLIDRSGAVTYIGWCQTDSGAKTTDPVWAICRQTFDAASPPRSLTRVEWAVGAFGGSEDQIWDNRAGGEIVYR